MDFASYYYFICWIFILLLTIGRFSEMQTFRSYFVIFQRENYKLMAAFCVFYILFVGFRPISQVFGDTVSYANIYEKMQTAGMLEGSGASESDWLFWDIMFTCSQITNVEFFFTFVLLFYVGLMFVGCKKIDAWHCSTIMLFCLGAFSFYTYSVNGIRNGVACSIVIMAIGGVCKGERIWPIVLAFIALGCHKSVALPLACMFFTYFVRSPKLMYLTWLGAIVISLLFGEIIGDILSLISYDERLADNFNQEEADGLEADHSFRWDFLLYGSMPIILGAYVLFKQKIYNNTYLILLGTYIYANAFWVLAIRAMFSNRIAYLSWFIYPIVLAYPLLNLPVFNRNHSQKAAVILLAHFGFTTVMWMLGK